MQITLPNNWAPRWYQRPVWDYMESGGRHAEIVFHRRSGKDDLALHWTALAMTQRQGNYWHLLPKANQARKALWDAINPHTGKRRIDEAFPQELRTGYNDHEMMLKIGDSVWQVLGSDNYDSLVGSPPIGLVFSEWALSEPSSWAYLRPIIAENGGWVMFNTTPRGKNHAYRTFRAALKEPGHFAQKLTAMQTDVFTAESLEAERRQLIAEYGPDYGQSLFDQEYLCSFDAANLGAILGRALTRAQTSNRITTDVFDPDGAPIEISSDIGRRDSSSWWFWQPRVDGFGIVNHVVASGLQAGEWCEKLAKMVKSCGYKLGKIWLPHDAKAKTFSAKDTAIEQFIDYFGFDKIDVTPNSHKSDRINAARTVIEQCHFDSESCDEGIEGLAAWTFEYNEETKDFALEPKHDWASHIGDAFSYGALVMRLRIIEEKKLEPVISPFSTSLTLEQLWAETPQFRNVRI